MPINYIPNDPRAGQPPMAIIQPHAKRPAGRADFAYQNSAPEGRYGEDSDEFLYWQCREAALRAVDLWEEIDDDPLASWQSGEQLKLIQAVPNNPELNAFYDRASLSFYKVKGDDFSCHTGASTDVVAHEAGHAFLDAIRPDLWGAFFAEQGAFHEAFGDCIAVMTALEERATREELLASDLLAQQNFVETTGEDLAHGVRELISENHNAAVPRTAFNRYQWALPSSLPVDGGPGELINEVHSLGMIFSGCFYDTILNIFDTYEDRTEVDLQKASWKAGRILAAAARKAPLQSRFFMSVGNAMLLADRELHDGENAEAIRE
ncbi:MAG: hypothetical protein RLO21_00170, partial [Nitratireductor sp.]